MKKILVIGATGMLGKPVTRALDKAGFDLPLLGRDCNRFYKDFPDKKIINGDVFNRDSLVEAMKGVEIVYINLSVPQSSKETDRQTEREGMENIIYAAKQNGVERLIYLSSLAQFYNGTNNFSWWVFELKHAAVEKVKTSGIPYIVFYPSTFMEIFNYQMRMGNRVMLMSGSVSPMWFIAAEDYANQVVNAVRSGNPGNNEYIVQGPEAFTMDEAAKIFVENNKNPKLHISKAPMGLMKIFGRISQKVNYGVNICETLNKYPEKFEADTTWKELGKPLITLREYART